MFSLRSLFFACVSVLLVSSGVDATCPDDTGYPIAADFWGKVAACSQISSVAATNWNGYPYSGTGSNAGGGSGTTWWHNYTGQYLCVWECAAGNGVSTTWTNNYSAIYRGQVPYGGYVGIGGELYGKNTNGIYLNKHTRVLVMPMGSTSTCYQYQIGGSFYSQFGDVQSISNNGIGNIFSSGSNSCSSYYDDSTSNRRRLLSLTSSNRKLLSQTGSGQGATGMQFNN